MGRARVPSSAYRACFGGKAVSASRKRDLGCAVCGYGPRAGIHRSQMGSYGFNWTPIRGFPHLYETHAYVPPKEVEA